MIITIRINNDGESLERNLNQFFNDNSGLEKAIGDEIYSLLIDAARGIDADKEDFKHCSEIVFGITDTAEAKEYLRENGVPEDTKINKAVVEADDIHYTAFVIGNNGDGRYLVTVPPSVFLNIRGRLTPTNKR